MKILLTLDLNQPISEERSLAEFLMSWIWDQLQVTGIHVETVNEAPKKLSLTQWVSQPSPLKKYKALAPSPLTSYDLIIGIDLPPVAEAFFNSLGIRTLILRALPYHGFARFVLARANFQFPQETTVVLPCLKEFFLKEFPPINDASPPHRNWWLGNQFLLKQKGPDPLTLYIGTSLFQPERIRSGSLVNLATYADTLISLLSTSPNAYYSVRSPHDSSEFRFLKTIGISSLAPALPDLLARDEFDFLITMDSGLVPLAEAFHKRVTLLGTHPTWTIKKLRQFCDRDFLEKLGNCQRGVDSTANVFRDVDYKTC
ncbi:MAG: hypothetical protein K2W99_04300 [Chthoniobacterales bacterium]|nr:hypothetical protein [Chthoniobacterales bacterium]